MYRGASAFHIDPRLRLTYCHLAATLSSFFLFGCGAGSDNIETTYFQDPYIVRFREYRVPVEGSNPSFTPKGCWPDDLDGDSQGNIWFAQHHSSEVGRMSPAGVYTGFHVPTPNSSMDGIAVDSVRQIVWVSEVDGNKIVRLDMVAGTLIEIPVPTSASSPGDLSIAPDGTVWFTEGYEEGAGRLAHIDPITYLITEVPLPNPRGGFDGIKVDAAGTVWFVELRDNRIGRYKNGSFDEFDLPRPGAVPTNLALDSAGRVWVSEQGASAIAVLDPVARTWREYPLPTLGALPAGIAIDAADNVWFTEFSGNKIGLLPAGHTSVVEFRIPTSNSGPEDIRIIGGEPWFTEQYGNKIGVISVGISPPH